MTRTRDWDVITGWEKRIKVDFGSIGPNHVRWSDWTYKERDIVARKVHESTQISDQYGPRSKKMEEWAAENAPIMVGFSRDGKPMPDWAHAEYRESGVPEYVRVVWDQPDPAGMGKWAYDPPAPWPDRGDDPAWSARPMEKDHDPNVTTPPTSAPPPPPEGFIANDLAWVDGQLLFTITGIIYPEGMDELLCMVESRDPNRGGWVTMSALEAMGSGLASTRTETVRNAALIRFVVPLSYNIQDHATASFKLYFRKSNGGAQRPDYMTYEIAVPSKPKELKIRGPVGLPQSGGMHSKYGGTITYRTAANGDHIANDGTVISTAESRAAEDIPDWRKFEIGRLEAVDGIILPGPAALPQDEGRYGGNRQFSKRHKVGQSQPAANPSLVETVRGYWKANLDKPSKGENWRRVLIAFGVEGDDGAGPFTAAEAREGEAIWSGWRPIREELERLEAARLAARDPVEDANRYRASVGLPPVEKSQADKLHDALVKVNERPDVVVKEFDPQAGEFREVRMTESQKREKDLDFYKYAPAMQGHFTVQEWERMHGSPPTVVSIPKWRRLAIIDPHLTCPNYWLEGEGTPVQTWRYDENGGWIRVDEPKPSVIPAVRQNSVKEAAKVLAEEKDPSAIEDLLMGLLRKLGLA